MIKQQPTLNQADVDLLKRSLITKGDLKRALKQELKQYATKEDLKLELKQYATKKDVKAVEIAVQSVVDRLDQLESNIAESLAIPVQNHEARLHRVESNLDLPPITP